MAIAAMIFIYNIFKTIRSEPMENKDPWNAFTLEWYADSPPNEKNFIDVPVVTSRRPLWDLKNPENRDYD
jgi:heme/copper-type cytochrome/quinol oxidase subunit 1